MSETEVPEIKKETLFSQRDIFSLFVKTDKETHFGGFPIFSEEQFDKKTAAAHVSHVLKANNENLKSWGLQNVSTGKIIKEFETLSEIEGN